MKKLILFIIVSIWAFPSIGQKLDSYTASNGVTYQKGDIVTLGKGSNPNGSFVHLQMGGIARSLDKEENQLPSNLSGLGVEVKAIRTLKLKGIEKIYFSVGGGNISNYMLLIEDAIAACEVVPCVQEEPNTAGKGDKIDQLKDLKELLDAEAISQEEYDKMKSEIIN